MNNIFRYQGTFIEVIYTSDIVEEIEDFLTYKVQNFVADVGGLLGLFLGCSLLSLVEIFYFIFSALTKSFRRKNLVENEQIQEINVPMKQEILRLKEELRDLTNELSRSKFSEMLKAITKLEANIKENSIKLSNLEKNVLVVEDF